MKTARLLSRGPFDLYLNGTRLIYVKDRCDSSEPTAFLHIVPVKLADLAADRQRYGFENHDFTIPHPYSSRERPRLTSPCVVRRWLPDYPIAATSTGQSCRRAEIDSGEREFRFEDSV